MSTSQTSHRLIVTVFGLGIILCMSILLQWSSISDAQAQATATPAKAANVRELLLRPGGWTMEWRGVMGEGEVNQLFEATENKIVTTINNVAYKQTCQRDVIIDGNTVKLDGCNDTNIVLTFDANDRDYPFKGEGTSNYYKMKPK